MDQKVLKNITGIFLGIIIIVSVWWFTRGRAINLESLSPSAIREYVLRFGALAQAAYILIYVLNTISVFPPIGIISISAGLIFGKERGAVILMIAAMLGTSCTFFISRFFGRGLLERFIRGRIKKLDDLLEQKGFMAVLFFRIVPLVPYEVLNYAGGFSGIRFRDYFLATFLGLIPGVIISAFFGGSLGEIKSYKDAFSFKFGLALAALTALALAPLVYRYFKRRNNHGKGIQGDGPRGK